MKKFYVVHIEVSRNVGNYKYQCIYKTLEAAKRKQEFINNYTSNENICLRDAHAYKITTHSFKDSAELCINENYTKMEDRYFEQHGEFAYY